MQEKLSSVIACENFKWDCGKAVKSGRSLMLKLPNESESILAVLRMPETLVPLLSAPRGFPNEVGDCELV